MPSIVQRSPRQETPARASAKGPDEGRISPWLRADRDRRFSCSTSDTLASCSTFDTLASCSTSFVLPGYGTAGPIFWTDETLPERPQSRLSRWLFNLIGAGRGTTAGRSLSIGLSGLMLCGGLGVAGARLESGRLRHAQNHLNSVASVRLAPDPTGADKKTGLGLIQPRLVETAFHIPIIVQTSSPSIQTSRSHDASPRGRRAPLQPHAVPMLPVLLPQPSRCVQSLVAIPMTPPAAPPPDQASRSAQFQPNDAVARAQVKTLAGRYSGDVRRAAARYKVPVLVAAAVLHVETRATDHTVISRRGAIGPMQLMPHTAWAVLRVNPWVPAKNIDGGVKYLSQMIDRFHSMKLALVAYNAGPTAVATATAPDSAWRYATKVLKFATPPESKFPY